MYHHPNQWFNACYQKILSIPALQHWCQTLPAQMHAWQQQSASADIIKWCKLLNKLPQLEGLVVDITDTVTVGCAEDIDDYTRKHITGLLRQFTPWRKGPFSICGIDIDTEWRSDWKWQRLLPHITPLTGRNVLDIGCGSGYHMWRMLGEGANAVFGIDPTALFLAQFHVLQHFIRHDDIHFLPLGVEQMQALNAFDTVFSMGVLYHRRDPITFLEQLKQQLRPGGELVLETLVVDGDANTVLMAGERYAQMRNVWFLPSIAALEVWLSRVGFINIRCVDVNMTSTDEQRSTAWMTTHSLQDFLDPDDPSKTIEGYPAPQRAVFLAQKKG